MAALWDLATVLSEAAVLTAVTFVAYMIGSILEIDPQGRVGQSLSRTVLRRGFPSTVQAAMLTTNTGRDLRRYLIRTRLPVHEDEDTFWNSGPLQDLLAEIPQIATRLQVNNVELFNKYDRLLAEASLRMNLAFPIILLLMLLVWQNYLTIWLRGLLTITVLVFGYLVLRQGCRKVVEARDVIIQALISLDEVQSRRLDEYADRT
jgi:hypothetical protein